MIRSYTKRSKFAYKSRRWHPIRTTLLMLEELESRLAPSTTGLLFHDVLTGDFNGDGKQDIAGRTDTGQWWVAVSNGTSFTNYLWTTWNEAAGWQAVIAGDFNGDGKTDIAGMTSAGQWWVALSTGTSFINSLWTTWNSNVTWVDVKAGDFDGDGKTDITGRVLQSGQWWTGISKGSSFTTSLWATWNPNVTWVDVKAADFNGDGKTDITGRYLQGGQWWTAVSIGTSFSTSLWAFWNPNVTWVNVNSGDFNGDGKADITGQVLQSGQWWTALSKGSAFTSNLWATWNPGVTWVDVQVGDFNGDGMADITGRVLQSGQWWTGLSTGAGFTTTLWDAWSPAVIWDNVVSANINGNSFGDLVGRVDADGQWWAAVSTGSSFVNQLWTTWGFVSTADQNFISQEYLDLLNRPVTPSELTIWTNLLNQGVSHFQQVLDLEASAEYRTDEVNFLYQHILGRAPLPGELSSGVGFLLNGGLFETLEAILVGSQEFYLKSGGTITGFLTLAYEDLLNRSPDAQGLASWSAILAGGTSRTLFASLIIGGPEYAQLQISQNIQKYLRRQATAADFNLYTTAEQQSGQDLVIAEIIGSPEYSQLAQSKPQTPIPTITAVSPTSAAVGSTVTISGSFLTGAVVTFNGVSTSVVVSPDGTTVSATVPVGATDGALTLTTPFSAMFGGSFSTPFIILPRITSFTPTSGAVLSQVTIFGNNFTGATSVSFNGMADPTGGLANGGFDVNSDTQITATVPNGVRISSGLIQVTTPDGTAISPSLFTVTAPGSPTISNISPNNVTAAGGIGGQVTITGTNFILNQTTAAFTTSGGGTVSATVQSINATGTSMVVLVPSGAVTGPITVANNTGSAQTANFFFVPTLGAGSPNPATFGSTITFNGTNLNAATVTVDGSTPAGLSINAAGTSLSFTVPSIAGSHTVQVTNAAGTASANFTANPGPPSISSVATNGAAGSIDNTLIVINGSSFVNVTKVTFNGTSIAFSVINQGVINVNMVDFINTFGGNNVVGGGSFSVVVTAQGGTSNTATFNLNPDDEHDPSDDPGGV